MSNSSADECRAAVARAAEAMNELRARDKEAEAATHPWDDDWPNPSGDDEPDVMVMERGLPDTDTR